VDHYVDPGVPAYDDWQLSEYEKAADVLSAGGGKVVWLTAPCLAAKGPLNDNVHANELFEYLNAHQIGAVAEARPDDVRVVDLNGEVCPGGRFRESYADVARARPDGAHFSDAGAEAIATWMMKQILP
jgi:hypothetical protein